MKRFRKIQDVQLIIKFMNFAELPVDVESAAGRGLYSRGGNLLSRAGAAKLLAQDAPGWNSPLRDEETLPGGHTPPGKCPPLSSYLRDKFTKTS